MKKQINKNWIFLVAPLITVIWLLVIYYAKGIYPFGEGTVIDYDLQQGGVPTYFYLYDAFHGGSLFHDFTTAGGFSRDVLLSLASPTNLFMLLFSRDLIIEAISLLLIFKLATIALSSSYGFSKLFPNLSKPWLVLIALIYTFSGYNLMYFTNLDWLDTVALYPLLIAFTLNLFKGKSKLPYFFTLSYLLVFHTYMTFFIVLSLIVFGGLYIFIVEEKNNKKKSVYALGISTFAALITGGLSVFNFAASVFGGARYEISDSVAKTITNNIDIVNVFMFLGMELGFACLFLLWIKSKKYSEIRKHSLFLTLVFSLLFLQVAVTKVNLAWHGGSYAMFPFRNGYMVSFFCCCTIGFFISKFKNAQRISTKNNIANLFLSLTGIFIVVFALPFAQILYNNLETFDVLSVNISTQTGSNIYAFSMMFLLLSIAFILLNLFASKSLKSILCVILSFVTIGINSFVFIGKSADHEKVFLYNNYYADCLDVEKIFSDNDALKRVNNPDVSLITNYPYLANVSAISNWTHSLDNHQIETFTKLGFSSVYTRVLDSGGTVFSKALLHITNSVSHTQLHEDLYTKTLSSSRNLNYYSNKFTLPLGLTFNKDLKDIDYTSYKNTFEYQNAIYSCLTNESNLFVPLNYKILSESEYKIDGFKLSEDATTDTKFEPAKLDNYKTAIEFSMSKTSIVYVQTVQTNDDSPYFNKIHINNEPLIVPNELDYYKDNVNTKFPVDYNNGVLELGVFTSGKHTISFDMISGNSNNFVLYFVELDKIDGLCESYDENAYQINKDRISFKVLSKNTGDVVFVPITFNERWDCTVNGKSVEPICVLGNFIGIEVDKGENEIKMNFSHKETFVTYAVMIVLFLIGFAIILIEKKMPIKTKWIHHILYIVFAVIVLGTVGYLYILPIIKTTISII